MTARVRYTTIAILMTVLAAGSTLRAQDPAKPAAPPPPPRVATKVDVVLTRSQGEKKVSSLPFTLLPTSNGNHVSIRIGVDVPIGTTTSTREPANGREGSTTTQPSYRRVGTDIDCTVRSLPVADGRYEVYVSVSDSSIFGPDSDGKITTAKVDPAAFRTFSASNYLTMKEGQTMLLATGVDKITGETLKVEVTFAVLK